MADFIIIFPKLVRVNKGKSEAAMHMELGCPVNKIVSLLVTTVAPAMFPYIALGL